MNKKNIIKIGLILLLLIILIAIYKYINKEECCSCCGDGEICITACCECK